jgi:uncharacterized membrane protein YuzA (DUF378 family)
MPTLNANAAGTDAGLGRFLYAVTFFARLAVLNAGLVGVFNWNLIDPLLGREPTDPENVVSRVLYIVFGLLSVGILCLLAQEKAPKTACLSAPQAATEKPRPPRIPSNPHPVTPLASTKF